MPTYKVLLMGLELGHKREGGSADDAGDDITDLVLQQLAIFAAA